MIFARRGWSERPKGPSRVTHYPNFLTRIGSLDEIGEFYYAARVAEEVSKNNRRRTLLVACLGVIVGFLGACVKGPTLVSWLFKPLQDSFSCSGSVNQALTQFVELQFGCAVMGALLSLVGLFFWRRFFRRRAEAKQSRLAG